MTTLERLSNVPIARPCWDGPESSSKNGGITQSLLGAFLSCPARFKAKVIDNLKPRDRFNHRMHYGNMFHLCNEAYNEDTGPEDTGTKLIEKRLDEYTRELLIQYPFDQEDILKWSRVCAIQFPVYLDYWRSHHENPNRTSLLQEEVFYVPYRLPSGRTVYLRGRWDGVELDEEGIWLCESKTKGTIDVEQIQRRLKYDLQTMLYLVALQKYDKAPLLGSISSRHIVRGVRYNVVRRPLSGGKGTIKQTKNETVDQYYDRLAQYIRDEPETYFFRWQSEVSVEDINAFEKNTLIPCLERLCLWWDWFGCGKSLGTNTVSQCLSTLNFIMPFGVNHVTDEYGSPYDDYITSGSTIGLVKCDNLFPEL